MQKWVNIFTFACMVRAEGADPPHPSPLSNLWSSKNTVFYHFPLTKQMSIFYVLLATLS